MAQHDEERELKVAREMVLGALWLMMIGLGVTGAVALVLAVLSVL